MLPDMSPFALLRKSLGAAMVRLHPSAELQDMPAEKLLYYAHEIAFASHSGPGRTADPAPDPQAEGWIVQAPGDHGVLCARRHYLVAEVDPDVISERFPALLGMTAKLRSHLGPDEQADVTMLLIAPPGAKDEGWVLMLERNEAFAQVRVFTPGNDQSQWPAEADDFVAHLRLGSFEGLPGTVGGDLSPVDAVFEGMTMDPKVREKWRGILMTTGIHPTERARLLLEAADALAGGTYGT